MSSLINASEASLPLSTLPLAVSSENVEASATIPVLRASAPQLLQSPDSLSQDVLSNVSTDQVFDPSEQSFISDNILTNTSITEDFNGWSIADTTEAYNLTDEALSNDSLHQVSTPQVQATPDLDATLLSSNSFETIVSPPLVNQELEYSASSPNALPTSSKELIVIDAQVEDYDAAVAAVNPNAEVFILDPSTDGIDQITELLSTRSDLNNLHIVSHGNSGQLQLGSTILSQSNLEAYGDRLQDWSSAFSQSADILIYGCNVAHGVSGQTFIDQISSYTGTDIAASTDYTGNANLNADWDLEYQNGSIETDLAFSEEFTASYEGVLNSPIRVEAEKMNRSGYRIESTNAASGGKVLSFAGQKNNETGQASFKFNGKKGSYDVVVGYFDENDGQARLQVSHKGKKIDDWTLNKQLGSSLARSQNLVRRTVASPLNINKGDKFQLKGFEKGEEHARIDYIEFIPRTKSTPNTSGGKETLDPSPEPDNEQKQPTSTNNLTRRRIEAEDMQRSNYRLESNKAASGGSLLSLVGRKGKETGTASFKFNGAKGKYDVVLGYVDETDGQASLQVLHKGNSLSRWTLDKKLGSTGISNKNIVQRTVARGLTLDSGDNFQIKGFENQEEHARIDYIEFIPKEGTTSGEPDDSSTPKTNQQKASKETDDNEPDTPTTPKNNDGEKQPTSPPSKPNENSKNSKLLLNDTFNSSVSKDWRREDSPDKSHSLNIVNDPTGGSNKVARFETRKSDPLASGSYRSELAGPMTKIGDERWYGFSTLLPSNWKTDPAGEIISQWHSAPDRSKGETWPGKNPPLSIHVDGNEMYIKANWNTGSGKKSSILWRGNYQKGDWTDWVVNTKWSNSSNGYIKVWKDDKLIVDYKGPNTHHDHTGGMYFKTGLYKYSWKRNPAQSSTNSRVLYVDNVKIGDKNSNYTAVDPS
ncbi:MAG: DUF4347 domain-containing protein [Cyanobacteria bacterium P01_E01_bin.6]